MMSRYSEFKQHGVYQKNLHQCATALSLYKRRMQFGRNRRREKFIFVDELNENEEREFNGQNGMMLNENEIRKVIDKIGSNPATLKDLTTRMPSAERHLLR